MKTQSMKHSHGFGWWASRITLIVLIFALVLGSGTWAAGLVAKQNLLSQYPAPGRLVDVGGYRMHIDCIGQGSPTVILLAGANDFSIFWSLVQPEVARFARVCAYDRAGLGWSEASPYPRASEMMVKELHTLLVNADVPGPYVLVGHSFGGLLARLFAYHFPNEVSGMVLVDAVPDDLFVRVPTWGKAVKPLTSLFRSLAPWGAMGVFALMPTAIPNRGLPDQVLPQYRAILSATQYFDTAIAEDDLFERNVADMRAAHITSFGALPLIVVSDGNWSPLEGVSDVSEAEKQQAQQAWHQMQSEFVSLSSDSKQIVAEKSGHFIQLDQPDLVTAAVRELVAAAGK